MTQNGMKSASMAPKKDTKFKKGNPGGPGRPKDPIELVMTRNLTKTEANAILQKFLFWTVSELETYLKDKSNLVIEYYVAKLIYMGIVENNIGPLSFLFERILGKVVDKVEVTRPIPTVIELLTEKKQILLGTKDKTEDIDKRKIKNENNS